MYVQDISDTTRKPPIFSDQSNQETVAYLKQDTSEIELLTVLQLTDYAIQVILI
jgi:hypothetical protein